MPSPTPKQHLTSATVLTSSQAAPSRSLHKCLLVGASMYVGGMILAFFMIIFGFLLAADRVFGAMFSVEPAKFTAERDAIISRGDLGLIIARLGTVLMVVTIIVWLTRSVYLQMRAGVE